MAHPDWPIIYVRGYAMSQGEIDDTTADPFCGFNVGSTVFRATTDRKAPRKFIFESPILRLAADYGYATVFDGGLDIVDIGFGKPFIPAKSIIVYRYYDESSRLLGTGLKPDIRKFGADLGTLIDRVRDLVCKGPEGITKAQFRCYLVAHSMGGLVCRTFLQDPNTPADLLAAVDKAFTYATPHNGIEMAGLNVPSWFGSGGDTFNRDKMAGYLNLGAFYDGKKKDRVDVLPQANGRLPADRFFCMIGTNRTDYEVAAGLSRAFAGNGSDGLVRIENASLCGIDAQGVATPCPTAYAYRAHSGYFGIVNSEEAYQNLVRFLFGNVRVDIWLDIDSVVLPRKIEEQRKKGNDINALYQFEVLASLRECRWYLTRRVAEEDSVACRTYKQLNSADPNDRNMYLSSIFMTSKAREGKVLKSLAYAVTIGVRVPDYEVDRKLWVNEHFEGGYIFRDTARIELMPPKDAKEDWNVVQSWLSQDSEPVKDVEQLHPKALPNGKVELTIPFDKSGEPGISGKLRFVASAWR